MSFIIEYGTWVCKCFVTVNYYRLRESLYCFHSGGSHKGFLVITPLKPELISMTLNLGPDLQNILLQSYDNAKLTIDLR